MKIAIAICLCLLVGTGACSVIRADSRYVAFMGAALQQIEARNFCPAGNCKFTYVVPASMDPRAREALASLRKVVAPSGVPDSAKIGVTFPNYIEIDKLQIVGDTALVEGNWYPYGHGSLNCGEGFSFPFKYANGVWVPLQWHLRMC